MCFNVPRSVALISGSCNLSCNGTTKLEPSMLHKSLFTVTIHLAFAFRFVVTALCLGYSLEGHEKSPTCNLAFSCF